MNKITKSNGNTPRTPEEIENMIIEASAYYGGFL